MRNRRPLRALLSGVGALDFNLLFWGAIVFTTALLLRLVRLDTVPANLNPDEADTLQTYLFMVHTGSPGLFEFNWNGAPALNTYLIGWSWELFGRSVMGLRAMSALLTAVACVVLFLLIRRMTRRTLLAVGAALLLATNPWFLNFSRSGWENAWNGLAILFIAFGLYILYEEHRPRLAIPLLITGSALGFYFYHPGKLFAIAVLVILLAGQLATRYRVHAGWIAVFMAAVGILILPQLRTTLCYKPELFGHFRPLMSALDCVAETEDTTRTLSIRNDGWHRIEKVSVLAQEESPDFLRKHVRQNLLGFARFSFEDFYNKLNRRYIPAGASPIAPAVAVLYGLGLIIALARYPYLVLLYLLVLLPVQILSVRTPDAARAVHAVPLIFLFAALPIAMAVESAATKWTPRGQRLAYSLIAAGLVIGMGYQSVQYWQWISTSETLAAREPAVSREEYSLWLEILEDKIVSSGNGFTVSQWKKNKDTYVQKASVVQERKKS